jgi:hypothetical protein
MTFAGIDGPKTLAKNKLVLITKNPAGVPPAGLIEEEIVRSERREIRRRRV